jgi:hypothetical protein
VTNLHCNKTKISRIESLYVSILISYKFTFGRAVVSFVYIKAERSDTILAIKRERQCVDLSQLLDVRSYLISNMIAVAIYIFYY